MTLAELLAALVIAATLSGLLAQSLGQLADRTGRIERSSTNSEIDRAAGAAFRRIVERAVLLPLEEGIQGDDPQPSFVLGNKRLVFLAAEPGYPSRAGLYAYGLVLSEAGDRFTVEFLRARVEDAEIDGESLDEILSRSAERVVIWSGAEEPVLSVFDAEAAVWVQDWEQANAPRLAALSLPGSASIVARLPQSPIAVPDDEEQDADEDRQSGLGVDQTSLELGAGGGQ